MKLFICTIIACFFLAVPLLSPTNAQTNNVIAPYLFQNTPEWVKGINFYLKDSGDEYLPLHPTVLGWGVNIFQDPLGAKWSEQNNIKDIEGHNLQSLWMDLPSELDGAVCINIDGDTMMIDNKWKFLNIADSRWQKWIKDNIKFQIDIGADGIMFDSPDAIGRALWEGGTFDEINMKGFREFLKEKYSQSELLNLFNIANIDSFNYRNYLIDNGLRDSYVNTPSNTILWKDFDLYVAKIIRTLMEDFNIYAKNYAWENYGKIISFSTNTYNMSPAWLFYGDIVDYFTYEHPYLGEFNGYNFPQDPNEVLLSDIEFPPKGKAIPNIKLGYAVANKTSSIIPAWSNYARFRKIGLDASIDLLKLYVAEAYSNGGAFVYHFAWSRSEGIYYSLPDFSKVVDNLRTYNLFIKRNEDFYKELKSRSEVAVLYSQPSIYYAWGLKAFQGACNLFIENNFQFDIVFSSFINNNIYGFSSPKILDYQNLKRYEILVLPNSRYLTDNDVTQILHFLNEGGFIIAWCQPGSKIGEFDDEGKNASRLELETMSTPGTHTYGNGKLMFFDHDLGWQYNENRNTSDLNIIKNSVLSFIEPIVKTNAPPTLNVFSYVDEDSSVVFNHILNY